MHKRGWLKISCLCLSVALLLFTIGNAAAKSHADRPNILWLTTEDIGPHLGCYGDAYADTPNLDRLAREGMLYKYAWSTAPVCAPARTTIISGVYPPSTGSEHMRSTTSLPASMKMYPQLLREAGYYCTNNSKEDYNLNKPGAVWDESSRKGHWKNRKPGQPFFAIFNYTGTHESKIRTRPHKWVHDPAKARIPAHHPDIADARQDWAQYYDNITVMDNWIKSKLDEIKMAGLSDSTIVFFYGDHGSGMPRHKRQAYDSGLRVPMMVYVPDTFKHLAPEEYKPGAKSDRLVGFVDLAPTLLSLAGVKPPEYMQGYAFMGKYETAPQPYIYGFRGRMDERIDMVRSIRDQQYIYVRNYMRHLPAGQHVNYMFVTPTTQAWKNLFDEGKLTPEQAHFWKPRPPEELFDLQADPDEVRNLIDSPEHQDVVRRMRKAQQDLAKRIRDVGFLPEGEIHDRSEGTTPYEMGHDDAKYPIKKIMEAADLASSRDHDALPALEKNLRNKDDAVRYWGAMGLLIRGATAVDSKRDALRKALNDSSPYVRAVAAQALGQHGNEQDLGKALPVLVELADQEKSNAFASVLALNAIDALGDKAADQKDAVRALKGHRDGRSPKRVLGYSDRLIETIAGK